MQFTFLDMAGKVLFLREDADRADWTTEEMTLDLEFPYLPGKRISIGQRIYFKNPADNTPQLYEVKQAKTLQPDSYQQIVAENICISELSDEHIDTKQITNVSVSSALSTVLSGTLWKVGKVNVNPTSSVDISRGSVWQAILQIKDNWNVYIEPRVSLSSNGDISRYLDVFSTSGEWNGVRLSIDKNMLDPSVTYDDSEVATALYGYGGTDPTDMSDDKKEITFENVVWQKTSSHPAKPAGQKYLEDPTATKEYGRNGRARFGFYQNSDIVDPEVLLQKTWETLQTVCVPAISIEGTVADLYRMGYADQPLKLHNIALVEILPSGYKAQIQIIRMTVDLLDASATTLTIGSYIPNIIYIERKTNEDATGSRGGGGGNKNSEPERKEFEAKIEAINEGTGLRLHAFQNDLEDMDNELKLSEARIDVEHDRITLEVTQRQKVDRDMQTLFTSKIEQLADRITLSVEDVENNIISIINQTPESIQIKARRIDLQGYVTMTSFNALSGTVDGILAAGTFGSNKITSSQINATGTLAASGSFNYKGHTVGAYACTTNGGATFYALGY